MALGLQTLWLSHVILSSVLTILLSALTVQKKSKKIPLSLGQNDTTMHATGMHSGKDEKQIKRVLPTETNSLPLSLGLSKNICERVEKDVTVVCVCWNGMFSPWRFFDLVCPGARYVHNCEPVWWGAGGISVLVLPCRDRRLTIHSTCPVFFSFGRLAKEPLLL